MATNRTEQRRRWSEEEKRAAVADVGELGIRGAARKHGARPGTVGRWVKKYGPLPRSPESETDEGLEPGWEEEADGEGSSAASGAEDGQAEVAADEGQGKNTAVSKSGKAKKSVARRYTPTQKAQALEYASEHGVSAAAKKLGISRFSIYEWQRAEKRASQGEGPSPTSGPDPADIEAQRDREILAEWRKHPGLGPSQIRNQLRRRSIKVSVNTVRHVMIDAGYRPPKIKRQKHDERFEATRPNHLWHLDFLHRYINRYKVFILILLDDYSRYVVGYGVSDAERADVVLETFEEAAQRHGRPEMVICDKGSAFWSWNGISRFTTLLTEMGIDQIVAEHKEWNGKLETLLA